MWSPDTRREVIPTPEARWPWNDRTVTPLKENSTLRSARMQEAAETENPDRLAEFMQSCDPDITILALNNKHLTENVIKRVIGTASDVAYAIILQAIDSPLFVGDRQVVDLIRSGEERRRMYYAAETKDPERLLQMAQEGEIYILPELASNPNIYPFVVTTILDRVLKAWRHTGDGISHIIPHLAYNENQSVALMLLEPATWDKFSPEDRLNALLVLSGSSNSSIARIAKDQLTKMSDSFSDRLLLWLITINPVAWPLGTDLPLPDNISRALRSRDLMVKRAQDALSKWKEALKEIWEEWSRRVERAADDIING